LKKNQYHNIIQTDYDYLLLSFVDWYPHIEVFKFYQLNYPTKNIEKINWNYIFFDWKIQKIYNFEEFYNYLKWEKYEVDEQCGDCPGQIELNVNNQMKIYCFLHHYYPKMLFLNNNYCRGRLLFSDPRNIWKIGKQ
jgi:hypothetical protein